jgi:hypothetical protein
MQIIRTKDNTKKQKQKLYIRIYMNIHSGTPRKVPLSFAWEKEQENKGKRLIFQLMKQIFLNRYGLTWASEEIKRYLKLIIKFL